MANDTILAVEARLKDFMSKSLRDMEGNFKKFGGTSKKAFKDTEKANRRALDTFKGFVSAQAALGAVRMGYRALTRTVTESIEKSNVQAKAEERLRVSLGYTSEALLEQASALQKVTLFGDESTIAAQALIADFIKEEETIKRLIPAIQDMAAAKGMNLRAAADLVTKSVASSTNALTRYGIQIEGAAGSSERAASAVESLEAAFGGAAEAAARAGTGPLVQMENKLGDVQEKIGDALIPTLNQFAEVMMPLLDELESWFSNNGDAIAIWAKDSARELKPLASGMREVGNTLLYMAGATRSAQFEKVTNEIAEQEKAIRKLRNTLVDVQFYGEGSSFFESEKQAEARIKRTTATFEKDIARREALLKDLRAKEDALVGPPKKEEKDTNDAERDAARERARAAAKAAQEERRKEREQKKEEDKETEEERIQRLIAESAKAQGLRNKQLAEDRDLVLNARAEQFQAELDAMDAYAQQVAQRESALAATRMMIWQNSSNAIIQTMQLIGRENKDAARAAKVLAVAQATINAYLAATAAAAGVTFGGPALRAAAFGSTLASGLVGAAAIAATPLQRGTTRFGGGQALVGEAGPELVSLPPGAQVTPAFETQRTLRQQSTINLTLNVAPGASVDRGAARTINAELRSIGRLLEKGQISGAFNLREIMERGTR